VVGDPAGELHGPSAVGQRYGHLFSNVKGEHADVKHRLYGENFVVDDKIWTAQVVGEFMGMHTWPWPPHQHPRSAHLRIPRRAHLAENVWVDAGAAISQLTSGPGAETTHG